MYEARQNKEKVSRRIDSNGRSRMTMNNIILPIQRLNTLNSRPLKICLFAGIH